MSADETKLFGEDKVDAQPKEKRNKLKDIDSLAKQSLDPWGKSVLGDLSDKKAWDMIAKGNNWAFAFSNLADKEEYRKGVGISQTAQVLHKAFSYMKEDEDFCHLIDPKKLQKLDPKLDAALKFLLKLDAGKGSENSSSDTFASLKQKSQEKAKAPETPEAVEAAAKEFFSWLLWDDCDTLLRVMEILSGVGLLWSGYAALRAAIAWAQHDNPAPTLDSIAACAKKRHFHSQDAAEQWPKRQKKAAKDLLK